MTSISLECLADGLAMVHYTNQVQTSRRSRRCRWAIKWAMVAVATDAQKLLIYVVGPVRDQDCSFIGLLLGGMTNK